MWEERVSVQPVHFACILIKQRRCGSCGVQEGREVVRVCVLVLVVVLMELEGHVRDVRLVLRRPA